MPQPMPIRAILLLLLLAATVHAGESKLWGALLLGKKNVPTQTFPSELKPYQSRLEKVFGYDSFEILGKSSHEIDTRPHSTTEQWLIPGKSFSVRTGVQPLDGGNFRVELQLYQDKKELVQTVAKLGPRSPLFIRGPLYGQGQLIIVIMVRDD